MHEQKLARIIGSLLSAEGDVSELLDSAGIDPKEISYRSFHEAGLLTNNHGVVVTFPDGSEFQVEVQQSQLSALADEEDEDEDD